MRAAREEAAHLRATVDDAHAAADAAQRSAVEARASAAQAETDAQQRIASDLADIERQVNTRHIQLLQYIYSIDCLIVNMWPPLLDPSLFPTSCLALATKQTGVVGHREA